MLQRQVMLKQLQELQRKQQQFLELGDGRNQNFITQLASLKQASGGQFPPAGNVMPVFDSSPPFVAGNIPMMQCGGSSSFQGFPNKLVHSQSQDQGASLRGISYPQYDVSLYGAPVLNTDKNFNNYPHLQGLSTNPLFKADNSSYGSPPLQQSSSNDSFLNQQCNQQFEEINIPDGLFQPRHLFQGKNLFEQTAVQNFNPGNYCEPENTNTAFPLESEVPREDVTWNGHSPQHISELCLSSLDPLEQKILYNTDDSLWNSSVGHGSNMSPRGFVVENASFVDELPSIQSGSWSALMQSAVAESSSSDTGIQEEWSGLSFQNPEPSADYQPTNCCDNDMQQNSWSDQNLQYVSSPCSKTEIHYHKSKDCSFPSFPQLGIQPLKQPVDSIASNKHTGAIQVIQTSLPSSISWPAQQNDLLKNEHHQTGSLPHINDNQTNNYLSGQFLQDGSWCGDSTVYPVAGGQNPFAKVNRLTTHGCLSESEKLDPGNNVELMPALSIDSEHLQSVTNRSGNILNQLNKDDLLNHHIPGDQLNSEISTLIELPQTEVLLPSFADPCNTSPTMDSLNFRLGSTNPWNSLSSYSSFPSLSMENSSATFSSQYVSDYTKGLLPNPSVPSHVASKSPAYSRSPSLEDFHVKISPSSGLELPVSDNLPSEMSVVSNQVGTTMGVPSSWPDMTSQQKITLHPSFNIASNLQSTDSASGNLETIMVPPNDLLNQKLNKHDYYVQKSVTPKNQEQKFEASSACEGSIEIKNLTSLSRHTCEEGNLRNHCFEADNASDLMEPQKHNQYHRGKKFFDDPPKDERAFGHFLNQNLMLQQIHPPINVEKGDSVSLLNKYSNANYQQETTNGRECRLSGYTSEVGVIKGNQNVVLQRGEFSRGNNERQNFLQDIPGNQSGVSYDQRNSLGNHETPNVSHVSQISLQMAPAWFKQSGVSKNEQMLSTCDPNTAFNEAKQVSGMPLQNLQENSLYRQADPTNPSQGSCVWPSSATTLVASKQLSTPSMHHSVAALQNLDVLLPKKRKILPFNMVPWRKEVNNGQSRLQNVSENGTAQIEWAQASNSRTEFKNEAEILEDVLPVVRAKRRLVFTTQMMQELFRSAPAAFLQEDARSACDCIIYSAARLALGDACCLTGYLPSENQITSGEISQLSEGVDTFESSKAVEGLIGRVNKLEGDISRMGRSLLIADVKVENQELEKISIINRFAKFYIKAQSNTIDAATSSSVSSTQKLNVQRYVMAIPMPSRLPEGVDCLSL